jgi:hypothetical protein
MSTTSPYYSIVTLVVTASIVLWSRDSLPAIFDALVKMKISSELVLAMMVIIIEDVNVRQLRHTIIIVVIKIIVL